MTQAANNDPNIRKQAIITMGKIGLIAPQVGKKFLSTLSEKKQDTDDEIRTAAFSAEREIKIGEKASIKEMIIKLANDLQNSNMQVRKDAIDTLERISAEDVTLIKDSIPFIISPITL